jgi:putative colanic acid biosynthesis acetyltransferase WcaF
MSGLKTDLSAFSNTWYKPGRGVLSRTTWYIISHALFSSAFPFYSPKRFFLRAFGAKLGKGVIIKPHVTIKYPWNLVIGDHVWIGEDVWIDNLAKVTIGNNACISQGALLLCGNHNYRRSAFDLTVSPITLEDGAWAGAKSIVGPGVVMGSHCVLAIGSVATHSLEPYWIYQGNPAEKKKQRIIEA